MRRVKFAKQTEQFSDNDRSSTRIQRGMWDNARHRFRRLRKYVLLYGIVIIHKYEKNYRKHRLLSIVLFDVVLSIFDSLSRDLLYFPRRRTTPRPYQSIETVVFRIDIVSRANSVYYFRWLLTDMIPNTLNKMTV